VALLKKDLYRLPWSKNDNPIAWLEVTDICNLQCEGCYRQRLTGHKRLDEIKEEVLFFKEWRNPDNVSIAGGEPLLHPDIVEIVAFIAEQDIKPIILTNGEALTPELLKEFKSAGLSGFTVHVDSHQGRPDWRGKSEAEHNVLRQRYAEMIAAEGSFFTILNATVYPSSYEEIPHIVRWGRQHVDIVHGLVFITYRTASTDVVTGITSEKHEVDLGELSYVTNHFDQEFVTGPEVVEKIKEACPAYEPSGYLGGTMRHDSFKWIAGAVIGSHPEGYGSIGRRTMEVAQVGNHLLNGRYLAYLDTPVIGAKVFLMTPFDPAVRRARNKWLKGVLRHPRRLFEKIRVQTFGIIQAPDIQPDGSADMCDSCPDMTYWNGTLINSCRMDEYRLFGGMLSVVEKDKVRESEKVKA